MIRLLEKLHLAKVLTKVDEGWEDHRRRIPRTVVSPGRISKGELAQPNARMPRLESASSRSPMQVRRHRTQKWVQHKLRRLAELGE